jgi:protein-arginine kinase activator protein McsA
MKEAIASENYERASQLRDEIRATEAQVRTKEPTPVEGS